jgi:hypothetical protein
MTVSYPNGYTTNTARSSWIHIVHHIQPAIPQVKVFHVINSPQFGAVVPSPLIAPVTTL